MKIIVELSRKKSKKEILSQHTRQHERTIFAQIERPQHNLHNLLCDKGGRKTFLFFFWKKKRGRGKFSLLFSSLLLSLFLLSFILRRMIVDLDVSRFFIGTERSFSCNSNHFLVSLFLTLSFSPSIQVSRGFLRAFEGWRGLDDDEATRGENSLSRNGSGDETFPAPQGTLMIALTRLGNRGRLSTITELSPFRRSPSWPFRPRGSWYPTIDSNYR